MRTKPVGWAPSFGAISAGNNRLSASNMPQNRIPMGFELLEGRESPRWNYQLPMKKASSKFRYDQKPLIRAEIPLSIHGLPFQSRIVAGESNELTLNLGTFFESVPPTSGLLPSQRLLESLPPSSSTLGLAPSAPRFPAPCPWVPSSNSSTGAIRPSCSTSGPHSATYHWKSRILQSSSQSPSIPRGMPPLGWWRHRRQQSNGSYIMGNTAFFRKKIGTLTPGSPAVDISGVLSGMDVVAGTVVPVSSRAVLITSGGESKLRERWGLCSIPQGRLHSRRFRSLWWIRLGLNTCQRVPIQSKNQRVRRRHPERIGLFLETEMLQRLASQRSANWRFCRLRTGCWRRPPRVYVKNLLQKAPSLSLSSGRHHETERSGSRAPSGKINCRTSEKKSTDSTGFSGKSMEADVSKELKRGLNLLDALLDLKAGQIGFWKCSICISRFWVWCISVSHFILL